MFPESNSWEKPIKNVACPLLLAFKSILKLFFIRLKHLDAQKILDHVIMYFFDQVHEDKVQQILCMRFFDLPIGLSTR